MGVIWRSWTRGQVALVEVLAQRRGKVLETSVKDPKGEGH